MTSPIGSVPFGVGSGQDGSTAVSAPVVPLSGGGRGVERGD